MRHSGRGLRLAVYLKGKVGESRTYVLQARVTNAVRTHAGRLSGINVPRRTSNSPSCSRLLTRKWGHHCRDSDSEVGVERVPHEDDDIDWRASAGYSGWYKAPRE